MRAIDYFIVAAVGFICFVIGQGYQTSISQGRDYCYRPPYMQITSECNRVPTVQKPFCPFP